jgi:adenine deaminase
MTLFSNRFGKNQLSEKDGNVKIISGNIVDIITEKIYSGIITTSDGKIIKIEKSNKKFNNFIIPGFIDAHVHVESSMLTPVEFARAAIPHGTVAIVTDPHEIANVLGLEGVNFMIENGKLSPMKFYFSAPSCVPATPFETSGGKLGIEEIDTLLQKDEIKYLGEFMNYPGVIYDDPEVKKKLALAKKYHKNVDGHAPGLSGKYLKKYVTSGISTDHECLTANEALEKIKLGMKILIREGSACNDFDNLISIAEDNSESCMFCCDDLHPNDLIKGHINLILKRALKCGLDIFKVLRMACLNPIKHYGLDVGLIQVGDSADFLIVEDLKNLNVINSYIEGIKVVRNGKVNLPSVPIAFMNDFNTSLKTEAELIIPAKGKKINVISALDKVIATTKMIVEPLIEKGNAVSDIERDILKIAVVNRYQVAPLSLGFIHGFGLKTGAIASSVAHDSHNIIAIGVDDNSITEAVNALIENKGGICVTDKNLVDVLPLPIAGIISNKTCPEVAKKYEDLEAKARNLGSKLNAPFMTLSFMALLVIPELKMSDKGLFDATKFEFVDLWVE